MTYTDTDAIELIKKNVEITPELIKLRRDSKELYALINGDDFQGELINKIEYIEGEKKSIARKKYSRDVQDFFERLFQPLDNIWYATGGNKVYNIENKDVAVDFFKTINNIKDSNTLSHWVQNVAMRLSHVDPNGIMFLEYKTGKNKEIYPTYKSINDIRAYERRGQLLEWLLFEPYQKEKDDAQYYRFVDSSTDRTFKLVGETYILDSEKSFSHPFKEVPAILNSNIVKVGYDYRISPITPILGLAKEYARDQSIKTIYKFLHGFPIHWRYVTECSNCKGTGKDDKGTCKSCDGRGFLQKSDVTDLVTLNAPSADNPTVLTKISGFEAPDLETWGKYNDELKLYEDIAFRTFWGTLLGTPETMGGRKTTTEVIFNKQPIENRLNKYADYSEFIEWKMSEWILRFIDRNDKNKNEVSIHYGRNYVIEPSDTILARYEEAKSKQENDIILDELFKQYLQATYRTNPIEKELNLLKSEIEPYLHQSIKDVLLVFGNEEAQRKILFSKWWGTLSKQDYEKGKEVLEKEYNNWFEQNKVIIEVKPEVNNNNNLNQ